MVAVWPIDKAWLAKDKKEYPLRFSTGYEDDNKVFNQSGWPSSYNPNALAKTYRKQASKPDLVWFFLGLGLEN